MGMDSRPRPAPLIAALLGSAAVALLLSLAPVYASDPVFLMGADISTLPQIEDNGGVYTEDGQPRDLLEILQNHGFNYVRLRLWHTPGDGYGNLARTLDLADRIRARGMGFLLDFHYSDTWADPGKQVKPAAWAGIPVAALRDSIYQYSFDVMTALKNNQTLPDMVQIGNEITCGLLWNDGRICGSYNTPAQWTGFAALLEDGIRGVRESLSPGDSVRIMIHIDRGGNNAGAEWFYDRLLSYGIDFDVIGLSYYPWWHGSLDDLRADLDSLGTRYDKDIVVVETAYPWTLDWYDQTHNIVGLSGQLHDGYPATVEGQQAFLTDLMDVVAGTAGGRGRGLFYWAPEHISTPAFGSPWENLALFDFSGALLGSISAFAAPSTGTPEQDRTTPLFFPPDGRH